MRLMTGLVSLAATLSSLAYVSSAYGKALPGKVTIDGPGLAVPIEITDPAVLEGFDPWLGGFIDWEAGRVDEPPIAGESYELLFYMDVEDGVGQLVIYGFHFQPDPRGERGYIYLPGPGEPWYEVNIGTIIRDEGSWHYASLGWDSLMRSLLEKEGAWPGSTEEGIAGAGPFGWPPVAAVGGAVVLAVAIMVASRQIRKESA